MHDKSWSVKTLVVRESRCPSASPRLSFGSIQPAVIWKSAHLFRSKVPDIHFHPLLQSMEREYTSHGNHSCLAPSIPPSLGNAEDGEQEVPVLGSELLQQLTLSDFWSHISPLKDTFETTYFFQKKSFRDSLCRAHCCSKTENLIHFGHFRISHTVVDSSN